MRGTREVNQIARMGQCSNEWDRAGAETLEGWACPNPRGLPWERTSRSKGRLKLRGAGRKPKARGRRSGEIPAKAFAASPRRAKPKGAASGWRAKHAMAARDFREAKTQEPRPAEPASPLAGYTGGRNGKWVLPSGNVRIPFGRRKLRRVNPKSAAGAKQNRQGIEGRKPSRGWSNPEGGT
jgi:hypothetical protein